MLLEAEAGVVAVEDDAGLCKNLVARRPDAELVVRGFHKRIATHHASKTSLGQGFGTKNTVEMLADVVVAQKQGALRHHRVIHEAVAVVVHLHKVLVDVAQNHHAAVFAHFPARVEVEFRHGHRVAVEIEEELFAVFGLLVVHINLSADALVTVSDRGCSLRHLNAVHPSARHIAEAKRRGQSSEVGHVFCQHLGVKSAEAQQFNLFCARDGIAIADVDRSTVLEALGEAATSCAAQAFRGDGLHRNGVQSRDEGAFLSRLDLHFVEHVGRLENVVVVHRFKHVVNRVVLIADAAEHKAADLSVDGDFVVPVGIGHHPLVDDFPIDVDAR